MFAVAGVVIGAVVGGVAGNYLDNKLNDAQTRKFLIQLWEEAHDNLSHGTEWIQQNAELMEEWIATSVQKLKNAEKVLLKISWEHMTQFAMKLSDWFKNHMPTITQSLAEKAVMLTPAEHRKTAECVFMIANQLQLLA